MGQRGYRYLHRVRRFLERGRRNRFSMHDRELTVRLHPRVVDILELGRRLWTSEILRQCRGETGFDQEDLCYC